MSKRLLITGGCGFVGHHIIEHFIKNTDFEIATIDKLSYSSNGFDRLRDIDCFDNKRVKIFAFDLCNEISEGLEKELGQFDYIFHVAAESHVDRSISNPVPFIQNNVNSTLNILEFARKQKKLNRFISFSTDETMGPAPEGVSHKEFSVHNPSNPYSASKSAQESFGIAYSNTYGIPVETTRTMNVIGERQHPEKFVPMVIRKTVKEEIIPVHAYPDLQKAGSRHYLHARNVAAALFHIINLPYKGYDEWHIAGLQEVDNLELARKINYYVSEYYKEPKKFLYEMIDFHTQRKGHDARYSLDSSKLLSSGFIYPISFEESLKRTIFWTLNPKNIRWLDI